MRRLAIAGVGLALLSSIGCGGGADVPPLPSGRFVAATQSVTPQVHLFGDSVVAQVDVIVDRTRFDPERIRLVGEFAPYEREGELVRKRSDDGRFTHLRFAIKLRCLVYDCLEEVAGGPPTAEPGGLPPANYAGGFGERKTIELPPHRLVYEGSDEKPQTIQSLSWPPLQSVTRLNLADTEVTGVGFPFEASVTPLPAVSYRFAPVALGGGLLLAALALLALPAVVVVRALRREAPAPVEEDETPELTPLERALGVVAWARDRSVPERREALEALAVELEAAGVGGLVEPTRGLAWSAAAPSVESIDELLQSVEEADGTAV